MKLNKKGKANQQRIEERKEKMKEKGKQVEKEVTKTMLGLLWKGEGLSIMDFK